MRQKWIDALNLSKTPNFKTNYVCSDHFEKDSIHFCDNERSRKRLNPSAVPKINVDEIFSSITNPERTINDHCDESMNCDHANEKNALEHTDVTSPLIDFVQPNDANETSTNSMTSKVISEQVSTTNINNTSVANENSQADLFETERVAKVSDFDFTKPTTMDVVMDEIPIDDSALKTSGDVDSSNNVQDASKINDSVKSRKR